MSERVSTWFKDIERRQAIAAKLTPTINSDPQCIKCILPDFFGTDEKVVYTTDKFKYEAANKKFSDATTNTVNAFDEIGSEQDEKASLVSQTEKEIIEEELEDIVWIE